MRPWLREICIGGGFAAATGLAVLSTSCATPQSAAHNASVEAPVMSTREVVLAFERMAFDERRPTEAMERYAAPDFIDHDPNVRGDRASVIEHLNRLNWSTGAPQRTIVHLVVEGDIAIVHHHLVRTPGDVGIAAVDIFRVRNGQLVEHWDVLQPIPQDSINPRAMF